MNEEVEISLLSDEVSVETPLVADYILPTASSSVLGGVKIGDNINIDSTGHIFVPVATESTVGLVKAGTGLTISSDGTLTATGTYDLPEATKTTLGGVYMDDELSTSSTHPVQNAVVSLELQELSGNLTTLSGTVSSLSTTVGNMSTTVGNLSTAVDNLDDDISSVEGNITLISGQIGDINDDIETLENGLSNMQGLVDSTTFVFDEVAEGTDIDSNTWTVGDVQIRRRGRTGVVYITLEGSLTIASLSYTTIYTQSDQDNLPVYTGYGVIYTNVGCVYAEFTTTGELNIYNNSTTTLNIGELKGSIEVLYV